MKIALQYRGQARRMYYGAVFESKNAIPAELPEDELLAELEAEVPLVLEAPSQ